MRTDRQTKRTHYGFTFSAEKKGTFWRIFSWI